ncbi:sensor histidine kinase [Paenibacillus bovis]|uniref:histidine kinase n=1 Tax=Paenibacillus bovis TaxID=1616788 RepID=A0A172ZBR3_9BACL|nr:HAMP domain-containing sensor histidine kinase [Paenibacillus bovis]ANF94943.1 hypothetical protein AR543_02095 [Paenibacillus bovis]
MTDILLVIVSVVGVALAIYIGVIHRQLQQMVQMLDRLQRDPQPAYLHIRSRISVINRLAGQLNLLRDRIYLFHNQAMQLEKTQRQVMTHIAHDLRTPLTSLSGYAEMLKNPKVIQDPELSGKYRDIIFDKARALTQLLGNFFEWTRLESGDIQIHFQQVNLTAKIEECIVQVIDQFEKWGIPPELELPAAPVLVQADPVSVERILSNLISNTIRYGHGGEGRHGIRLWAERNQAWVEVWDTGEGIPADELPLLFDRLYQASASRHSPAGSGLGLAITKKLVEKQHGQIRVESTPYVRTSFKFCLERDLGKEE